MSYSSMAGAARLPAWIAVFLFAVGVSAPAHAANQQPTIAGKPSSWVYVGSQYSFKANGYDAEGATLRYSIQNKPAWASFATATGLLSGTPTATGLWNNIRISVSDGTSSSAALTFSIRATGRDNVAPVISGKPATSVVARSTYLFVPTAYDANGDPVRFTIVNRPAWATFNSVTGQLSGTPVLANAGTSSNITIYGTDGSFKVALAPFSITVLSSANRAPTISGTAPTAVTAGQTYQFRPTAVDADKNTLGFSILNRPVWATFSSATGELSGTPTSAHIGSYTNIVISVSDGKASTALAAFPITVVDVSIGAASLEWMPPTQNTDGSALTDLAGYRIVYGRSATQLTQTIQVANAGMSSYVVDGLAAGTYYFAVRAYTSKGAESADSNVVAKIVQ